MILMAVMFECVAGLDIGKKSVTVWVRTPGLRGGRHGETRTFRTMTRSLELRRDWLAPTQRDMARALHITQSAISQAADEG